MRRRFLFFLLALLALVGTPTAHAHTPDAYGCRLLNASQDDLTGPYVFEGIVVGWVADSTNAAGTVRCDVRVNGVVAASSAEGSGQGVIATASRITYAASDTDSVMLCVTVRWMHGDVFQDCQPTILIHAFPQELADVIDETVATGNGQVGCMTIVNTGTCLSGLCLVNTGLCEGGTCVVNLDYCGRGCVALVNTQECGTRPQARVDP